MLGFIFRDDYDANDAPHTFDQLAEPRDVARERGGFLIFGYTPRLEEGADQSDPLVVGEYLLKIDGMSAYTRSGGGLFNGNFDAWD